MVIHICTVHCELTTEFYVVPFLVQDVCHCNFADHVQMFDVWLMALIADILFTRLCCHLASAHPVTGISTHTIVPRNAHQPSNRGHTFCQFHSCLQYLDFFSFLVVPDPNLGTTFCVSL